MYLIKMYYLKNNITISRFKSSINNKSISILSDCIKIQQPVPILINGCHIYIYLIAFFGQVITVLTGGI